MAALTTQGFVDDAGELSLDNRKAFREQWHRFRGVVPAEAGVF